MAEKLKEKLSYSAEDKQAFADKDRRITKLSCLDRAVEITIARDRDWDKIDKNTLDSIIKEITEIADKLVDWVYKENKIKEDIVIPEIEPGIGCQMPTDVQKKIIYQIAHTLNDKLVDKGDKRVVDVKKLTAWIYKAYGKYPTQENSIQKILNNPGIECCLIENTFTKNL